MYNDETTPRRSDIFPDNQSSGPGCIVWGIVIVFGLVLAVAIVLTAAYAGFDEGVGLARQTEIAVTAADAARQCEIIPTDIAAGRTGLLQQRFESMMAAGGLPSCAVPYIGAATQVYIDSLATDTPTATVELPTETVMPTLTLTSTATEVAPVATEIIQLSPTITPTTAGNIVAGYDLDALLNEARGYQAEANYDEAIRTLDAIIALDENFHSEEVNTLLFRALTQQATLMFRTENGSLSLAISLTNRARQFGDVGDLNFEALVAQYYLDAQAYVGIDYAAAISLLNQLRGFSPNYRDGEANRLLFDQYVGYGDALAVSEPCRAVAQYDAALSLFQSPNAQTKRDVANQACAGIAPPTADPNATGVAPIGQPGT